MSDRNEYTPWVELGMTELDYWKAMYLDIQVQWAPVIEAARAHRHGWQSGQNMDVLTDVLYKTVRALEEVE